MRKRWNVCMLLFVATCFAAAPAVAAGSDPSFNFAPEPSCTGTAACLLQAVSFLDQARAKLGQPPYELPRDFASLDSAEQLFVLTDLDRLAYGLRPIYGLTAALDQAATAGVQSASDPMTTDPNAMAIASNWAAGYRDAPFADEAWMYDDGLGSENIDCTLVDVSGCWGHRENILSPFGSGPLAMGAAAGVGPSGAPGFAALLVEGDSNYRPTYVYTWSDAVAEGAGGTTAAVSRARPRAQISCVRAHHHRRAHRRRHRYARCRR